MKHLNYGGVVMRHINVDGLILIIKKLPKLFVGLFLVALGVVFMLNSNMGMNPWGILTTGLSDLTGITYGRLTQIIGFVIVMFTLILKIYPGVGTILNMLSIGSLIDWIMFKNIVPVQENLLLQILSLMGGMLVFYMGIYLYLSCGLGAGPKDGLMLGFMKLTGLKAGEIRPKIEFSVVGVGLLLGGPLGIGTLFIATFGGKCLECIFKWMHFNPKETEQMDVVKTFKLIYI